MYSHTSSADLKLLYKYGYEQQLTVNNSMANKLLIDQFHVLRYCFLNNALCLCGSYDCT